VGGELTIVTGAGDDLVSWDGGAKGGWTIRTGRRADTLLVNGFEVTGEVNVKTRAGPDVIRTFTQTFRDDVEIGDRCRS
jgi:hypothetical protein